MNANQTALVNALNAAAVNLEDGATHAASRHPLLGKALRTQAQELRDTALVIEEEARRIAPPEGVVIVPLGDPKLVHETVREALGE